MACIYNNMHTIESKDNHAGKGGRMYPCRLKYGGIELYICTVSAVSNLTAVIVWHSVDKF